MITTRPIVLIAMCLLVGANPRATRAAGGSSDPPALADRLAALEQRIDARRVELHIPGLALAIVADGEVVYAHGFGMRNLAEGLPVTPDTLFAAGSTTKAFTAALAVMLEEDGVLELSDKVTDLLPSFRLFDAKVQNQATLRDLLCHRIGLTRTDMVWMSSRPTREQILDAIATAEPVAPFRQAFGYNNIMFLAAGLAEGAAAKSTWEDLLRTRLFEPLGMQRSNLTIEAMRADADHSLGYAWKADRQHFDVVPMRDAYQIAPAGAINSSVNEMAHWITMLLDEGEYDGHTLIGADALEELWRPQISMGGGVHYGLGWMLREWSGHRVVEHGGNIDGFAAQVGLLPDDGIGFVLLANVFATSLQSESLSMVFETLLPEAGEAEADALPVEALGAYAGEYVTDLWTKPATALIKDGRLALDVPGQMAYDLHWPDANGKWVFRATDAIAVRFDKNERDEVCGLTMFQAGLEFYMEKAGVAQPVDPAALPADTLDDYAGTFDSTDKKVTWRVFQKRGRLKLDVPGERVYTLQWPDEDGHFRTREFPGMWLDFERDADDAIDGFVFRKGSASLAFVKRAADPAQDLPTVDALMSLRATHGGDRIDSLGVIRSTGRVRFPNQGLAGEVIGYSSGFDRAVLDLDFGVFGFIVRGADAERIWSEATTSPLEVKTGAEVDEALRNGLRAFYGDLRSLYAGLSVVGRRSVDGREVITLEATTRDGAVDTFEIDGENGLPIETRSTITVPEVGALPNTTRYQDWREVEGVPMPFKLLIENPLTGRCEMVFERIDTHVDVSDKFLEPTPWADRHPR